MICQHFFVAGVIKLFYMRIGHAPPKTVQYDMLGSPSKKGGPNEKETLFRRTNCQNFI